MTLKGPWENNTGHNRTAGQAWEVSSLPSTGDAMHAVHKIPQINELQLKTKRALLEHH